MVEENLPVGETGDNQKVSAASNLKKGPGAGFYVLFFIGILFAGALGAFGGYYYANSVQRSVSETPEVSEKVMVEKTASATEVEGIVWRVDEGRRIEMLAGDEIKKGDGIETEEDGRLVIALSDGSTLRIGENTSAVVVSLSDLEVKLVFDSGAVFALVEEDPGQDFIVETEDVSVRALGTAFSVENYEEVKVNVYESKVEVSQGRDKFDVEENFEYSRDTGEKIALSADNFAGDNFLQWSLEQELQRINNTVVKEILAGLGEDATKEDFRQAADELDIDKKALQEQAFLNTAEGNVSSISLSGEKTSDGAVSLNWTADGLAESGYKVVWSQTPGKPYPGDKRTHKPLYGYAKTLGPMKSGTWYYRVCEWTGETCGVYSNEITISF